MSLGSADALLLVIAMAVARSQSMHELHRRAIRRRTSVDTIVGNISQQDLFERNFPPTQ